MGSIPVGVTKIEYAAVAQLVEQLTCRMNILFRIILHLYVETYKVDTANSGKTKWKYVNPELGKKFLSVETLYGVPKAKAMVKRKSRLQTHLWQWKL